jgi:hypothetical protein
LRVLSHKVGREKDCAKGGFGVTGWHSDEEVVAIKAAALKFVKSVDKFELEVGKFPFGVDKFDKAFEVFGGIA